MKPTLRIIRMLCLTLVIVLGAFALAGCTASQKDTAPKGRGAVADAEPDTSAYIVAIEDEPDTVDFQCTSIHYTVAQNVFNRLVEMEYDDKGDMQILPSLAERWEVSEDGKSYTFHLRPGVRFSNGSDLTASDVQYTFIRLLTHPNSCNRDIVDDIAGAQALESGQTDVLAGFTVLNDLDFVITLDFPFQAFLACLSMPGASILDQQTTEAAGVPSSDSTRSSTPSSIAAQPWMMPLRMLSRVFFPMMRLGISRLTSGYRS